MKQPFALIIEDDDKLSKIFSLTLEATAYTTEIVRNGQAALGRLAEVVPDLVILDLHLPYVSGKEILQHIRADERLNDTRIILATADAFMADELQNAADLVLLKPISVPQLSDLADRLRPNAFK